MKPTPGEYQHFKGGRYTVFFIAVHSETEEELVIYSPKSTPDRRFARPLSMWSEHVERDGYCGPRFVKLS